MKKLAFLIFFIPSFAFAVCNPFVPGQVTSAMLNAAIASPCINAGTIDGSPIGLVTPSAGKFTTLYSTAGVSGVLTSSATTGTIGEYVSTTVASGSAITLTTATVTGIASAPLTAGDWDVDGVVCYHGSGTTNVADIKQGVHTASAVMPSLGGYTYNYVSAVVSATDDACQTTPVWRLFMATSGVAYLNASSDFTVSTLTGYGFIRARRTR